MKYPYLTVALLIVFGIIDIALLGNQYELTKSDWPGWVQAIGSIAALAVAIYVMSRQNRHAAMLLMDADKRALVRTGSSVHALMVRAEMHIGSCSSLFAGFATSANMADGDAFLGLSRHVIAEAKRVLVAVPAHELGSYPMTVALQNMVECLGELEFILQIQSVTELYSLRAEYTARLGSSVALAIRYRDEFGGGLKQLAES